MNPDIYARTVRGKPINPGVALYRAWKSILVAVNGCNAAGEPMGQTLLGTDNYYGIGVVNDALSDNLPVLGFGSIGWSQVSAVFVVNAKGEFQLRGHLWGFAQRNRIAEATFLRWEHFRSRYQWFISPKTPQKSWGSRTQTWTDPIPYLEERHFQTIWSRPLWWKAESTDGKWVIRPSRVIPTVGVPSSPETILAEAKETVANYEKLVERRYLILERRARIASGEIQPRIRSTLTEEQREERREKQMLALMAHLTVQMPAKTTPLRRNQERGGHGDPVDSRDSDGAANMASL